MVEGGGRERGEEGEREGRREEGEMEEVKGREGGSAV